jgi:hypothetical protein
LLQVFEYLLQNGADPTLTASAASSQVSSPPFMIDSPEVIVLTRVYVYTNFTNKVRDWTVPILHRARQLAYLMWQSVRCSSFHPSSQTRSNVVVKTEVLQGRGWKVGEVKETLSGLVQKYSQVPKKAAYTYTGPNIGESPVWYWRGVMDYVIDSIFGI